MTSDASRYMSPDEGLAVVNHRKAVAPSIGRQVRLCLLGVTSLLAVVAGTAATRAMERLPTPESGPVPAAAWYHSKPMPIQGVWRSAPEHGAPHLLKAACDTSLCPTTDPSSGSSSDQSTSSGSTSTSGAPGGYRLVFQDDFSSLDIAANKGDVAVWSTMFTRWNVRYLAGNNDKGVKVADDTLLPSGRTAGAAMRASGAFGNRQNYLIEASNGTLKLRAYPLPSSLQPEFWNFPYVASMINADQLPGLQYGYWEIRARINAIGRGQHLAFWLLPDDGSWPPEVDMLEVVGTKPHQFSANTHAVSGQFCAPMTFYSEPASTTGFHTYGFLWTGSMTRWTIDGKVVRQDSNCIGSQRMHLLVSWEIGSNWPGLPDSTTPWPAEVELDYVKAYSP